MRIVIFLVFLLLSNGVALPQKDERFPSLFIDAQQGYSTDTGIFGGVSTDKDLNTIPEIVRMLYDRAAKEQFHLKIVFEKEQADYIWLLSRENKWNSRMYAWLLLDTETGQPAAHGKEVLFRNAVKDLVDWLKVSWKAKMVGGATEASLLASYPAWWELPKKLKKGVLKNGRVFVSNTNAVVTLQVDAIDPDIVSFAGDRSSMIVETCGGDPNVAEVPLLKKKNGKYFVNATILSVAGSQLSAQSPVQVDGERPSKTKGLSYSEPLKKNWWDSEREESAESEPVGRNPEVGTAAPPSSTPSPRDVPQSTVDSNFRSTRWGMTREQVIAAEGGDIINEDQDQFLYKRSVIGRDVLAAYYFSNHRLVRARYALDENYTDKNNYLTDYNAIKDALCEKYGEPAEDSHEFKDAQYAGEEWGEAIAAGHLTLIASWKTPDTKILMNMLGDGTRINLVIEYREERKTENVF